MICRVLFASPTIERKVAECWPWHFPAGKMKKGPTCPVDYIVCGSLAADSIFKAIAILTEFSGHNVSNHCRRLTRLT